MGEGFPRALLLAGLCVPALSGVCWAQEPVHHFDIPAGAAADGLEAFGSQSGEQVLFPYNAVAGRQAPAIAGDLPDAQVLRTLADAAGLVVTSDDGKTVTLQAAPPPDTAPDQIAAEILVTARRHDEALSKTPMAITADTGDQLVEDGVVNADQLQYVAPNLTVSQTRQGLELTIRGITTTDTSTKGEPDIAFNVDGVPMFRSEEQGLALFDLQRVEVLNGPQSTLYGIASTGGAINVISNPPGWKRAAAATVEIGNYQTRRVRAMANQPLNDQLALRVAVAANQRQGYVRLIGGDGAKPGDENNFSGRISLLGRFGDGLNVRLTETGGTLGGVGQADTVPVNVGGNSVGKVAPVGYANPFAGHVNDFWNAPALQIDRTQGDVRITYLGAYNNYREDTITPTYGLNNEGGRIWIRERFQTWFNELHVENKDSGDRLQYVAGLNYLREQSREDGHAWDIDEAAPVPIDPDFANVANPINITIQTSVSAFLHTIYAITPKLRLTIGVRQSFDQDSRNGTFAFGEGLPPNDPVTPWPNPHGTPCVGWQDCIGVNDSGAERSNAFVYNTGLDYQITPSQMIYISANRGYKPGGFNDPNPSINNTTAPYGPETLNAYEVGYRLHLPAGTRFSATVFYYDFAAEQLTELANFGGNLNEFYTLLKPTQEYGGENSLSLPVTRADLLVLSANFLHGTYSRGNGAITGWSLSNMPTAVLGVSFTHRWVMNNGAVVKLRAATRYSSSYLEDDVGDLLRIRQPSFTRSDADISYQTSNGAFTTQMFVTNIENKVQLTQAGETVAGQIGSVQGQITTPRFWGVREIVKF